MHLIKLRASQTLRSGGSCTVELLSFFPGSLDRHLQSWAAMVNVNGRISDEREAVISVLRPRLFYVQRSRKHCGLITVACFFMIGICAGCAIQRE